MSYACQCDAVAGYSGFFDELMKVTEIALPAVGGLQGLQAGANDGGGFLGGLLGGLKGVTSGYQQVATMKQPTATVTTVPATAQPRTGVAMPTTVDSLLGSTTQWTQPGVPIASPGGMTPEQIAAQHRAYLDALYAAEQKAKAALAVPPATATPNKMLLYGGLGVGALVLLLILTRR